MELKFYGADGAEKVVKGGEITRLKFGTVRKFMKLLKVGKETDAATLLGAVDDAWEELTGILFDLFPDVSDAEWDDLDAADVAPALYAIAIQIMRYVSKNIPKDPKNAIGA